MTLSFVSFSNARNDFIANLLNGIHLVHDYYKIMTGKIWRNSQLEGGKIGPNTVRDNIEPEGRIFSKIALHMDCNYTFIFMT